MIAVVCDTTYQLMCGIFLAHYLDKNEKLVLFLNQSWQKTTRKFDLQVSDEKIHRIYYYSQKQMGAFHLLSSFYAPQKMLASLEDYDFSLKFSAVIAPRTGWIATYLMDYLIKNGRPAELYLIEEGLGEYNWRMPETRFTKMAHRLHKKCHTDMVSKAYFTAPEIYPFETCFPIEKLPGDASQTGLIDWIIRLFKAEDDFKQLRPYKFIFLSQVSNLGELDEPYRVAEKEMGTFIGKALGRDDYAVKLHPRVADYKINDVQCLYTQAPFELFAAKENIEERVIISTLSTAMLTPKMLLNTEPYLVCTYKLAEDILRTSESCVKMFENVKKVFALYHDQSKVFIPETYEELKNQLKDISRRIDMKISLELS